MEMETVIEGRTPAPSPGERETIYDLQGRKLLRAPQKGIYIQDGKKVVKWSIVETTIELPEASYLLLNKTLLVVR